MYPTIPAEMISGAVQLAVYFVTVVGVFLSFILTSKA